MYLKTKLIEELEGKSPLLVAVIKECDLVREIGRTKDSVVVHVISPGPYYEESLRSKSMWPRFHSALCRIIGDDFAIKFTITKTSKEELSLQDIKKTGG